MFGKKKPKMPEPEFEDTEIMDTSPDEVPLPVPAKPKYGYKVTYSKEQIMRRMDELSDSEDVQLYLKVRRGEEKAEEFNRLQALLKGSSD